MQNAQLSPHETLYLHELLSLKNICAVKASTMQTFITDQELKGLISQDVTSAQRQMQEIQGILNTTPTFH